MFFFAGLGLFFLGAALFGSQSPGLAGVLSFLAFLMAYGQLRRGLYAEPEGVRIAQPWRLHDQRVEWGDISRFELVSHPGRSPVTLIRSSDQGVMGIPTFPKPRGSYDDPRYKELRARAQAQVDELNQLLEERRTDLAGSQA